VLHVLCREGNLIWPVLLDKVSPSMRIAWEEPFGPVLPVMRVNSVDEAVAHCNSSNLGLQGCVFTQDINQALRISDAMQTGTVQVSSQRVLLCGPMWGMKDIFTQAAVAGAGAEWFVLLKMQAVASAKEVNRQAATFSQQ
jgi:acyl-CoA reductase-like NAD-dependent aldehyde dehydrogenase